ncbi:MAG: hypothetical protein ACYTGG_01710 [Planctomycetota bacterium]|jgi:hypothetical protein
MAISTVPRPAYVWRCLIIAVMCLVFGIWGIYDYAVKIPAQQRAYEKLVVLESIRDALESTQASEDVQGTFETAINGVQGELKRIIERETADRGLPDHLADPSERTVFLKLLHRVATSPQSLRPTTAQDEALLADAQAILEAIATAPETERNWFGQLLLVHEVLLRGPRREGQPLQGEALLVFDWAQQNTTTLGPVSAPAAYDRAVQWLFILCLPLAPYYLMQFLRIHGRRYRLDDDGTLHMPEGTWKPEEIAEIDMGRWMEKSVAEVVHQDGRRARLDDYLHRDLHLIVGRIAHRFDPDRWNEDATKVKKDDAGPVAGEAPPDMDDEADQPGDGTPGA